MIEMTVGHWLQTNRPRVANNHGPKTVGVYL